MTWRSIEDRATGRAWLISTACALAEPSGRPIDDNTPLAEGGLNLDSIRLHALLSAVEDHFGIAIPEDEITEANLGTIGRALDFIARRR